MPIDRIAARHNNVQCFERDQKAWREDGDSDYCDEVLNEPTLEPVVVAQVGGLAYPWDAIIVLRLRYDHSRLGWHTTQIPT